MKFGTDVKHLCQMLPNSIARQWFKISSPNLAIRQKQFWHETWLSTKLKTAAWRRFALSGRFLVSGGKHAMLWWLQNIGYPQNGTLSSNKIFLVRKIVNVNCHMSVTARLFYSYSINQFSFSWPVSFSESVSSLRQNVSAVRASGSITQM